ncbi:MAG: 16S rRNA (guanine(966)-N(2))-methyltransferase RsmD [Acidimicrobiaceae bacterium]|nr:16S rRNA (guanine(966)-N(2))-methyltransferase RsmD [Acidimicrobiaceae bacterium]
MRIVAGELRGRKISAPEGNTTRPTTDMAREAIFNALVSMNAVVGARILDLFAGSGALGIEALSRGALHCTFIERDRDALASLQENLKKLSLTDRTTVVRGDALILAGKVANIDLVLADPPYEFVQWGVLLASISAQLVVAESNHEIAGIPDWVSLRSKRYGRTHVTYLRRVP